MNQLWKIGSVEGGEIDVSFIAGSGWSFDGFTGPMSSGSLHAFAGPFTVEDDGPYKGDPSAEVLATGIPATWTGELSLEDSLGATLFEIQMTGVGTASFAGYSAFDDIFRLVYGDADVTGVGQVVYEDPSVPEPSTLTLMSIAGIASILAARFRRARAAQN
jgi:hypothetical protein